MTSNLFIGFILGLGVAAWVYAKMMKSTGGNTKNALIVSGTVGFIAMIAMVIVLGVVAQK